MNSPPMVIEFLMETELAFHESCAAGFHAHHDFLLVPDPSGKRIRCLGPDLKIREKDFFTGDQQVPDPYPFGQPMAVVPSPGGGFYVCDASSPNILFFDVKGAFEYAKSPPGILEIEFKRPANVAADASDLAVVEEDMTLHLINHLGEHRTFHLSPLTGNGGEGVYFPGLARGEGLSAPARRGSPLCRPCFGARRTPAVPRARVEEETGVFLL